MRRRFLSVSLLAAVAFPLGFAASASASERSCSEVLLPMSDGVRLYGRVNHEVPEQRRPVLLTISSYTNDTCPGGAQYLMQSSAANNFTMVFVNMRGSGSSEGEYDLFGEKTRDDIHAIIHWAATAPWSNGHILLAGASGNGLFMFDALQERAVKAAISMTSCLDLFRCFHRGGTTAPQIAGVYGANMLEGYEAGAEAREKYGLDANPAPPLQLAALSSSLAALPEHPLYDEFWAQRSLLAQLAQIRKPIMFTTSNFDLLEPLDAYPLARNHYLNLGMSHSVWWDFASLGSSPTVYQQMVLGQVSQFALHYMADDGTPAPARVVMMTADGGFPAWYHQDAFLREEHMWPPRGTEWTNLQLSSTKSGSSSSLNDGSLVQGVGTGTDTLPLISSPGVGQDLRTAMLAPVLARASGADTIAASEPLFDLRAEEAAGLTYTTPILQKNVELSGPAIARIWASTVSTNFSWALRLADVAPDGSSEWITDGYLRAGLRAYDPARSEQARSGQIIRLWRNYDALQPIPIGEPTEYDIQFSDLSNVFRAGHRIRLDLLPLAGSGYGAGDDPGAGTVTVLHDGEHPSTIQLPLIAARCQNATPLSAAAEPLSSCAKSYAAAVPDGR